MDKSEEFKDNLREQIGIQKRTPVEQAILDIQTFRASEEYKNFVHNAMVTLGELQDLFFETFPPQKNKDGKVIGISIITGSMGREKSDASIEGKIKKMELERLSKLYAVSRFEFDELRLYTQGKSVAVQLEELLTPKQNEILEKRIAKASEKKQEKFLADRNIQDKYKRKERERKIKEIILIERAKRDLSGIYTIDDNEEYYQLLKERLENIPKEERGEALDRIDKLFHEAEITKNIVISNAGLLVDPTLNIDKHTKQMIARYLFVKTSCSNIEDRKQILTELSNQIGAGTEMNTERGSSEIEQENNEANLIKLNAKDVLARKISTETLLEKLRDPKKYLRPKDLMGIKLVINKIPDDYVFPETLKPKEIVAKLEKARKNSMEAILPQEKRRYSEKALEFLMNIFSRKINKEMSFISDTTGKEFAVKPIDKDPFKIIYSDRGYSANHHRYTIENGSEEKDEFGKLLNTDEDDMENVELQIKTNYMEQMTKTPGSSVNHDDMPLKHRLFLDPNDPDLIAKVKKEVPRYHYVNIHKEIIDCSLIQSLKEYGFSSNSPEDKDKVIEIVEQYCQEQGKGEI